MAQRMDSYWSTKKLTKKRSHTFARLAARLLKREKKILELGAGGGADTFFFAARGHTVTAVDISSKHVDHIRKKATSSGLKVEAKRFDLAGKFPWKSQSFDAAYAHLSLHYIDDAKTKRNFREIHRVLKRGG
ncbi:class I SAM-dependent methyltransferase, partial [Candidatus Peregrinibacteria bacterium]|nr:class I SAM-dependent methyltransferase [Candidatus Peregrinibacteria bacterium]